MIRRRPLTADEIQRLANKLLPKQADINNASSELHDYEMQALIRQDDLNAAIDSLLINLAVRVKDLEDKANG